MVSRTHRMLLTAMFALASATALAQVPASPAPPAASPPAVEGGAGPLARGGPMGVLRLEQVQEELKITAQQRAQIEQLIAEVRRDVAARVAAVASLPPEQRAAQIAQSVPQVGADAGAYRKRIDAILTAEQKARLRQITVQLRGTLGALADDQVATALSLTDEQKARLTEIRQRVGARVLEAVQDWRQDRLDDTPETDAQAREAYRDAVEQSLGLLTPSQRDAFEKLQGDKFVLDHGRLPPRRRGLFHPRPEPPAAP